MKQFVEAEIQVYSNEHHAAIQKADIDAWQKFEKNGTEIFRLSADDIDKFQRIATPIWFKWANKDKDAARLFKAQLEIMESPSFGYVTPDMYKGQKLDL
jgi:TRAP-type C4-dicarboxylate transport system substrate-binding protein